MVTAILQIAASIFGYLSARGIDGIVGKYLAYIVIAWEQRASEKSKEEYGKAMAEIKANLPASAAAWDSWRRRAIETPSPETKPLA